MRDFSLSTQVPEPNIPIGVVGSDGNVYVTETWRQTWFEPLSTALFGADGGEDVLLDVPQGAFISAIDAGPNIGLTVSGTPGPGYTVTLTLAQDIRVSAQPSFAGLNVGGNISVAGTVDGRDISFDGAKLDGIEAGATADQTAAEIRALVDQAANSNVLTDGLLSKLNAIEDLATRNASDAQLRNRATHTGTQAISTVDGLQGQLDGKVNKTSAIPDAETNHDLNMVTLEADTEAALNALGTRINQIIAALS